MVEFRLVPEEGIIRASTEEKYNPDEYQKRVPTSKVASKRVLENGRNLASTGEG